MPNNIFLLLLVILLSKFCRSDTHLMYLVSLAHSQSDTQMGPFEWALIMVFHFMQIATLPLWGYPHVKWEIDNLSQITTTAPIFLLSNYFRQKYLEISSCSVSLLNNIWVRVEHSLMQNKDRQ